VSAASSAFSAIAAFIAVATSVWAHRSADAAQRRGIELERRNAELAEMQNRLSHQSWADGYFRDVNAWASDVSLTISKAIHFDNDEIGKREILTHLSASIDTGRWYFPNSRPDDFGQDKEPAYKGFRQPCLDWIVRAYDIFSGQHIVSDKASELIQCQRNFVSCIQSTIDPQSREQAIRRSLSDFSFVAGLPQVQKPK
jgi:hypothetical protein